MENIKFQNQKKKQLKRKDRSNEGKWDEEILELCEKINSKEEYYTTSSCSGRIVLNKGEERKSEDAFLFKTHKQISFSELKKALEESIKKYSGLIYFKEEPGILHVACSDLENAKKLLILTGKAGWKRSGIIGINERVILEIMSTEKLEMPIADNGKILVDDSYLRLLIKEANKKLDIARQKIEKLEKLI